MTTTTTEEMKPSHDHVDDTDRVDETGKALQAGVDDSNVSESVSFNDPVSNTLLAARLRRPRNKANSSKS